MSSAKRMHLFEYDTQNEECYDIPKWKFSDYNGNVSKVITRDPYYTFVVDRVNSLVYARYRMMHTGGIHVLRSSTLEIIRSIPMAKIGVYSESLAISKEGRLYVGMNNLVTVYDAETLREVMKINLLNNTSWVSNGGSAIAISDTDQVVVSLYQHDYVFEKDMPLHVFESSGAVKEFSCGIKDRRLLSLQFNSQGNLLVIDPVNELISLTNSKFELLDTLEMKNSVGRYWNKMCMDKFDRLLYVNEYGCGLCCYSCDFRLIDQLSVKDFEINHPVGTDVDNDGQIFLLGYGGRNWCILRPP